MPLLGLEVAEHSAEINHINTLWWKVLLDGITQDSS